MKCDVENFYTNRLGLLQFTIKVLNYLPALKKLWQKNFECQSDMRILDVGCGTGALTQTLWEKSQKAKIDPINFFAFDVTQAVLDEFRLWTLKKEITNIRTIRADAREMEQLPVRWRNFDVICSSGVLEYLDEIEMLNSLEKIHEFLKPGGRLIAMGSRKHPINYLLINWLYQANLYSKDKFVRMLNRVGFQKINFWKFPFPYSYLNLWGYIVVAEK